MSGTRLADGKEIDTAQLLPGKVSIVAILTSAVSEVRDRRVHTSRRPAAAHAEILGTHEELLHGGV
jgi:hypothetical protein